MSNKISNTKTGTQKPKIDVLLSNIINFGSVILFFGIAVAIYLIFFDKKKTYSGFESFIDTPDLTGTADTETSQIFSKQTDSSFAVLQRGDTIYESSLKQIYNDNTRLLCSMLPNIGTNICSVNGTPYIIFNFPVHMIKLLDGSILAVFNDGRLYQKDNVSNTMWSGPLNNSLPNDNIPLRMITLSTDLITLLGIGYDNKLYMKQPIANANASTNVSATAGVSIGVSTDTTGGTLNLTGTWKQVPNNTNIIYIIFDTTGFMISIDIAGKLFTKTSSDLTSNNIELNTQLDRPILRMYNDLNGYMLVIDTKFDLYQFADLNWKTSSLNIKRGANASKIQDIMYDNDGRLFGLVFTPNNYMVQIMKQDQSFYLAPFIPLDQHINNNAENTEFVMTDQDIILSKTGNINTYLQANASNNANDDDPNVAYQKQIIESRAKLHKFCLNRSATTSSNYDNYDLLANVEQNDEKIMKLKNIINTIIVNEPDKIRIQEKYPIILN